MCACVRTRAGVCVCVCVCARARARVHVLVVFFLACACLHACKQVMMICVWLVGWLIIDLFSIRTLFFFLG